jgi:uncharacterized repeat protein (TIGR04138 family)
MEANQGRQRHVTGQELLAGFRDLALKEFGPMAATMLREWGLCQCQDVGDMVFNLIDEKVFGKQDSDSKDDFTAIYNFDDAFVKPFQPRRKFATAACPPA